MNYKTTDIRNVYVEQSTDLKSEVYYQHWNSEKNGG